MFMILILLLQVLTLLVVADVFNIVKDCGAVGDNSTCNTAAITSCFAKAAMHHHSTVLVPTGVFLTGTVNMPSYTTLLFEDGAWLQGSNNPSAYSADWDYWHVVQSINTTGIKILGARNRADNCGIVGNLWGMVRSFDPIQRMLVLSSHLHSGSIPFPAQEPSTIFLTLVPTFPPGTQDLGWRGWLSR